MSGLGALLRKQAEPLRVAHGTHIYDFVPRTELPTDRSRPVGVARGDSDASGLRGPRECKELTHRFWTIPA